jgi:predicted pyridoxine 5'-phosphate oxidase superfamily flavin-nucleotide-binding protein
MTFGIVRTLVKCGVLPPKKTGPANPMSDEDAKRARMEGQTAAVRRRKQLIREAQENGEPMPVFKRGRPRKYTPEEALLVKVLQDRESMRTYTERVREGIVELEARYGNDTKTHSTDEHFFVATN